MALSRTFGSSALTRTSSIPESATLQIADLARQMERSGGPVIKLQTGDPDFATPSAVIEAAYSAMQKGWTHYAPTRGLPELRQAIAEKLSITNGVECDPDREVLVTHGGVHAVYCTLQALIRPGDEVLICDPCWAPYVSATTLAGGRPIRIATDRADRFAVTAARLEKHATSRTRLLILNTPCNPTGRVIGADELQRIADFATRGDLLVLSDEVYEALTYGDAEHRSIASLPGMKDRTITVNSFSKTFAMTGWRVGYLAAPNELVSHILKLSQYSITNVAPFSQKAAVAALTEPSMPSFVEQSRTRYESRLGLCIDALREVPNVGWIRPQGAFYLMIDISRFGISSAEFCRRFLIDHRVAVVPGVAFGECADGMVRMTFAASEDDLLQGIERLRRFVQELSRAAA